MIWLYLHQMLVMVFWPRHATSLVWAALLSACLPQVATATNAPPREPVWLRQPLSLVETLNLALQSNSAILKSAGDVRFTNGLVVETRAVAYPKISGDASYRHDAAVERFVWSEEDVALNPPKDAWAGNIRLRQSIYQGGRIQSALRTAAGLQEQALLQHQVVVANALLEVRVAYYDALLAQQQVAVQEAAVKLLAQELTNTSQRFQAGTVPHLDVLRGEVELVNTRTDLIKAQNTSRLAKYKLINLLGHNIPPGMPDDLPLILEETKQFAPYDVPISVAIVQAVVRRPELGVQRTAAKLHQEQIVQSLAGYRPELDVYGGYGARNPGFEDDFYRHLDGPNAGVEFAWNLFDGGATRGEVAQAQALLRKTYTAIAETRRTIETEVRVAYSSLAESRAVLASQEKVQEQAEEALRLAERRYEAGANTQLDLLKAQTDLTLARTTQHRAWRDYAVALARLGHALGQDSLVEKIQPPAR